MGAWLPDKWITEQDKARSRTSFNLDDLRLAVEPLAGKTIPRMVDVGCGFGGLSRLVGDFVNATDVFGVDIDPRVIDEARSKNVDVTLVDAGENPLPYEDGSLDLVMSLGMMDYLVSFDPLIREMNRVLRPGGHLLVALPNLGSWNNRLMLLLGYQPRDVEISNEVLAGVAPRIYKGEPPAGHIHIPTVKAFTELMDHHGFNTVNVSPGRPTMHRVNPVLDTLDKLLTKRVSLARRFYYLGTKEKSVPAVVNKLPHELLD